MANQTLDFNDLNQTNISSYRNFDVGTYELQPFFYPYNLYVEERISDDIPKDSKTNLYELYDAGINNLEEDDWTITASEKITSHTQFYLTNNYNTVVSNFLTTSGSFDKIHYNELITELSGLENLSSCNEMSAKVMKWINDYVNDFSINQNPENADDSNLILTQALKANIQSITENILKKVFRNLVQLIRFKRDYRMYGRFSTIYGNCYNSDADCQKYTAVPASCFTQRSNHYIVGKKAYGDNITSVGGEIKNAVWHIAPSSSYAIAKHVHNVSIDIEGLKSSVSVSKSAINNDKSGGNKYTTKYVDSSDGQRNGIPWGKMAKGGLVCDWKKGVAISIISSGEYSYSWKSNSPYCKLVSESKWTENPWDASELKLPTYSTRVWVWSYDENGSGTNITDPMQYISG